MTTKDIIVIGSSAGGVQALTRLCAGLPAGLPATIFVAQHLSPSSNSMLPTLLERAGPLPATAAVDGQRFERGHIYVGVPDRHLLVRQGHMLVRRGPVENRTRPAVDALFRSAALAYGGRVIGVVLTGLLDDGTGGLIAITAAGGLSIVQDPAEAEWPSMPLNALKRDHVSHVVGLDGMAELVTRLVQEEAGLSVPLTEAYVTEDHIAAQEFAVMGPQIITPGKASHLSCPDCGGVLNQLEAGTEARFRCQVGHAYSALGLVEAKNEELERALGVAVRTHRDRNRLFDQMADNARKRGMPHATRRWEEAATDSAEMIAVLERAASALHKPRVDGEP